MSTDHTKPKIVHGKHRHLPNLQLRDAAEIIRPIYLIGQREVSQPLGACAHLRKKLREEVKERRMISSCIWNKYKKWPGNSRNIDLDSGSKKEIKTQGVQDSHVILGLPQTRGLTTLHGYKTARRTTIPGFHQEKSQLTFKFLK